MTSLKTNTASTLRTLSGLGMTGLGTALLLASGCPAPNDPVDASVTSTDAFVVDQDASSAGYACPIPAANGGCPTLSTGEDGSGAPDFSGIGAATAPVGGDPLSATFRLTVFGQDGQVARNTRIFFFPDNIIRETCASPECQEVTTDSDGKATVTVASGGWYAYRVFENRSGGTAATRYTDSVQYNERAPSTAGQTVDGNAVAQSTLDLIPLSLGLEREPGTTILAGRVQDTNGAYVGGALVRAFRPDGTEIVEASEEDASGAHYRYFRKAGDESKPSNEQLSTNYEGLYAAMNLPASSDRLRVEAWGRLPGSDDLTLLGCEAVSTLADGVTIINIYPLRSDYPGDHPCARYLD